MTWPEAIADWMVYLRSERRLGTLTLAAYHSDISSWIGQLPPSALTPSDLRPEHLSVHWDEGRGAAPRTRKRRQSSLRSLLTFLAREGLVSNELPSKFDAVKAPLPLADHLTESEWQQVMGGPQENPRVYFLLSLMGGMGLRVSEVANLVTSDYSPQEQILKVRGKGDKIRFLPVPDWVAGQFDSLPPGPPGGGIKRWVFPGSKGRPLSRQQIWNLVRARAKAVGIQRPVYPHMFRHGFATRFLASGAGLRVVQEVLGHASVQTTERYTHLDSKRLRQVVERAHPFAAVPSLPQGQ